MPYRALIIEDNVALAAALADVLADEQIRSDIVAEPPSPNGVVYDVVLADLDTPGVRDALPLFAERSPVIVMSSSRDEWLREAFRAGATACLPKPFGLEDLVSLLGSLRLRTAESGSMSGDVDQLGPAELERLRGMSSAELDALPFGLIVLGRDGTILEYNAYESEASRFARAAVVGMKFRDLAPCTSVTRFQDKLAGARAMPGQAVSMRFFFPHRGATALVTLRMVYDRPRDATFLVISKRMGQPARLARHPPPPL